MKRARWFVILASALAAVLLAAVAVIYVRGSAVRGRTYRIGFENDPPFHFPDAQGRATGLVVNIINEAARRKGIRLQWQYESVSSEMALRSGHVDLWPLMTIRPERKRFLHITAPYRESETCFIVRADRPYTKPADVDHVTIGQNGQPLALRLLKETYPRARIVEIPEARTLLEAVCHGEVEASYMDEFAAVSMLMAGADCVGTRLRVVNLPGFRGQLGVGATFESAAAADALRAAITDMADEGSLSKLVAEWGLFTGRSMELNTALIQARRRARVMLAMNLGMVSLVLLAGWQALRIRHQRNRAAQAEAARAKLEEHLQQVQRMDSIGRLAGGVAHDFNNLLTVINGYTELLLAEQGLSATQQQSLQQVDEAGRQAASLTQQLLAFSRKQIIQPRPLSLNAVIEGVREMLRRLLGEDIELTTVLQPDLAQTLADPGQMHQVVMNLVVNARDAMPNGGKLRIETANVDLDAAAVAVEPGASAGPHVRLTVADSGVGMDAETLAHIFEPFFTTKGKGEGTGLGLSMVYGIVKQSRGWIQAESKPGKGSTFTIFLPQVAAGAAADEPATATLEGLSGSETVLLVEDQASVRQLAASVLRGCGYRLLQAGSAEEALEVARGHDGVIDLLLTDVVLPGLTGKDLADRLTDERPDLKVLFTSGYTEDVIAHRGVLAPGIRYLPKPYAPRPLAAKVREVLDQK